MAKNEKQQVCHCHYGMTSDLHKMMMVRTLMNIYLIGVVKIGLDKVKQIAYMQNMLQMLEIIKLTLLLI